MSCAPNLLPDILTTGPGSGGRDHIVVVHDNDFNTEEQVIQILMTATQCSPDEAAMETWEVHHLGKSVVHVAGQAECDSVAEKIRTIGITVTVEPNLA
jgi:ATP-dependent Clp protease adapter protein ClpS